jgi:hypothetical protein
MEWPPVEAQSPTTAVEVHSKPSAHTVHTELPADAAYCPVAQARHAEKPMPEYVPATHVALIPPTQKLPGLQRSQLVRPSAE